MRLGHVSVHIENAIAQSDEHIDGMLTKDNGTTVMSATEVREFFKSELDKGYKYFSSCNSRSEDGSCAGHFYEPLTWQYQSDGEWSAASVVHDEGSPLYYRVTVTADGKFAISDSDSEIVLQRDINNEYDSLKDAQEFCEKSHRDIQTESDDGRKG